MRSKVLETHELQEIELIRMEYMFRTDRNSISLLKDVLGDGWNVMTQSLLARNFLIWDEKKRLQLSSKSIRIIAAIEQPIWKN